MQTTERLLAEIKLLMDYAVPPDQLDRAISLVEKHGMDRIALNLFHAFYSYLPEAEEDAIHILRLLANRQGSFLILAGTGLDNYLYLVTGEGAEFLGPLDDGIWDEEVLAHFNWPSRDAFLEAHRDPSRFPVYVPVALRNDFCPVCQAVEGELHSFGCPVEICPWCGGQLTSCQCRFEHLGRERLSHNAQLDQLLILLEDKGRIPFDAKEHRPAYPTTPADLT